MTDLVMGNVVGLRKEIEAKDAEITRLREVLAWYGEQARLARLIHIEGDIGRQALAADGGARARSILQVLKSPDGPGSTPSGGISEISHQTGKVSGGDPHG